MYALGVVLMMFGCRGDNEASRKTQLAVESQLSELEQAELVAQIGDRKITLRDLERRLNELDPLLRSQYGNSQRKIGFLIEWVRLHLLANEALKEKLLDHPHVIERTEYALVKRLVEEVGKDSMRAKPITSVAEPDDVDSITSNDDVFEQLRAKQQRAIVSQREAAVKQLLNQHSDQRRVTYASENWLRFKRKLKMTKGERQ
ncbi:MAG: hypothetical protein ACPGQS_11715 [Bradymonadia bacterium]